jgi:hypothetical protein
VVVAKVRERLVVNKQSSHSFHIERFILKKLNEVEGRERYRFEVPNRFAALEGFDAEVDRWTGAWTAIRENIKISAKESLGHFELKKHKPWFDEGCPEILVRREHAKLRWLQDPSEISRDNLKNVRREASKYFRNKRRE